MGGEDGAGAVEEVVEVGWQAVEVEAVAGHVLVLYHVEGGAEDLPLFDGLCQVGGADYGSARGVDEVEGVGEAFDEGVGDHVSGFGGEGDVEAEDVGAGLEFGQGDFLHVVGGVACGLVFVVGQDGAFKALQPLGKGAAHVAKAYDAHGAAFDFEAAVGFALPQALAHLGIGGGDVVEEGQEEAEGMLAHGVAVAFGRVEAADAEAFGIGHVDGFHAGPEAPDAAEVAGAVEKRAVDGYLAAYHEGVVASDLRQERVAADGGVHRHGVPRLLQQGVEYGVGVVGDEYFHFLSVGWVPLDSVSLYSSMRRRLMAPRMPMPPSTLE